MSAGDYMEIAMMLREEAQRHFEYWLTISFAFVAASFFGRGILKPNLSIPLAGIYLLTVALLVARYAECGMAANRYLDLAVQQGAEPLGSLTVVAFLRMSVFVLGTLLSFFFLYVNTTVGSSDS